MSTDKKAAPALVWKKLPEGGEYAAYKLGTIRRFKGYYSYSTAYNNAFDAKDLAEAKRKIDQFTRKKTGE